MAATTLTVFRLRTCVKCPKDALSDATTCDSTTLTNGLDGTLFVRTKDPKPPPWVDFFKGALHDPAVLADVKTSSPAAVLVLWASSRYWAFTFGSGRALLDMDKVVERFGLKYALGAVDTEALRGVNVKDLGRTVMRTLRQSSKASNETAFPIDGFRDVVTGLTGRATLVGLDRRVVGTDALSLGTAPDVADLPKLCKELSKPPLSDFTSRWHERIKAIPRDGALHAQLDKRLVAALNKGAPVYSFHLAPPQLLDMSGVQGYRFSGSAAISEELSLDDYVSQASLPLDADTLRKDRIELVEANGDVRKRWSVYRCLVGGTGHKGDDALLGEGRWTTVPGSFGERLDDELAALPATAPLPPAGQQGQNEDAYIKAVAKLPGAVALHQKDPNKIEPCDLVIGDRLIHVKLASASVRVLCNQAVRSGEALVLSADYRKKVSEHLKANKLAPLALPFVPSSWEVALVVVTQQTTPKKLGFGQKLDLVQAAHRLRALGYRVTYTTV